MSDIKMSDVFEFAVDEIVGGHGGIAVYLNFDGDAVTSDDENATRYAAHAINTHDTLVAQNLALKAALETLIGRTQKVGGFPCGYLDDAYKALEVGNE